VGSLELDKHTRLIVLATEDNNTHDTEISISIEQRKSEANKYAQSARHDDVFHRRRHSLLARGVDDDIVFPANTTKETLSEKSAGLALYGNSHLPVVGNNRVRNEEISGGVALLARHVLD
jgi:hypothetical protein